MTTALLIWLYGWGVIMCAMLSAYVEDTNGEEPRALGAVVGGLFWPVIVPFVVSRRAIKKIWKE